jgi:ParB family chromosome partitioning protein
VIVGPDTYFQTYDYEKTAKRKGGKVFIDVHHDGEVVFHEGFLTRKEARRTAAAETTIATVKVSRPEITSTMLTYIDLHRHAAVRADLIGFPAVALRVMVAHAIAGSPLWRTSPDPRTARNAEVAESTESCAAETAFDQERRAVQALLGLSPDELAVTGGQHDVSQLFLHLLALSDGEVMRIISVIMGETMMAGSAMVEAVAGTVGTDMAKWWSADDAFFSCIRDKEVLTAMVAEVAGTMVASANAGEKTKTLKGIVKAHLEGADGRIKVEHWVPRWMRFAPSAYTGRGGVGTVKAHAKVEVARAALAEAAEATEPEAEIATQRLAA